MSLQLDSDLSPAALRPLQDRNRSGLRLAARMAPGYLVALVGGTLFFRFGGAFERGNELSVSRSVFTAVNALTLTGFEQDIRLHQVSMQGAAVLFGLTLIGTLFSLIIGGLAIVRILRLHYTDRQIIVGAFAATLIAVLLGTIGVLDREGIFEAMFLSLSAFGNSGLYLGQFSDLHAAQVHGVLLPLAFCGGLGLTVLMELFDRATGIKTLSIHARTVLVLSAAVYLGFFLVFFVIQRPASAEMVGIRHAALSSSAAAMNLRGAGLPIDYAHAFPLTMQWVIVVLMMIGGNPGGTAAGLKPTTLLELLRGVRAAVRGERVRRAFGIAAAWTIAYLALVLVGFLLLLWRVPDLLPDRLLFLTFSAASNVGLAHDPVSITGPGLYTLSAIMLLGRLAPLVVLWWMARTTHDADIAVG